MDGQESNQSGRPYHDPPHPPAYSSVSGLGPHFPFNHAPQPQAQYYPPPNRVDPFLNGTVLGGTSNNGYNEIPKRRLQDLTYGSNALGRFPGNAVAILPRPDPPEAKKPRKEVVKLPSDLGGQHGQRHGSGGVFDDADNDDWDGTVCTASISDSMMNGRPAELKRGLPVSSAKKPSPPGVPPGGGIFDDAEGDETFTGPTYNHWVEDLAQEKPPTKYLESSWNKSHATKPQGQTSEKVVDPIKKPKKKISKPIKRVLIGRKEMDQATSLLSDKHDLMNVLEPDHCWFLGKTLWIFCVEQLESILNTTTSKSGNDPEGRSSSTETGVVSSRQELLDHVAKSHLVKKGNNDKPTNTNSEKVDAVKPVESEDNGNAQNGKDAVISPLSETKVDKPAESGDNAGTESEKKGDTSIQNGKEAENQSGDTTNSKSEKEAEKLVESGDTTNSKTEKEADTLVEFGDTINSKTEKDTPVELGNNKRKVNNNTSIDKESIAAAMNLLQSWDDKIKEWRQDDSAKDKTPLEKIFMLNGPVSCLFPTVVQRFLASVPIASLHEFLCLKKTETGAIVAYCAVWRRLCKLPHATPLAIAKHMLGMGFRAETAMKSFPHTSSRTRQWVGDPLVVMTGAAREFLTEYRKTLSGTLFIETR